MKRSASATHSRERERELESARSVLLSFSRSEAADPPIERDRSFSGRFLLAKAKGTGFDGRGKKLLDR